jgi:ABC-type antimicrobial peptide transport system permease subunit
MLYGINANDWFALAIAIAAMLAVVMAAGYAPAWRASRIDPMIALRHE